MSASFEAAILIVLRHEGGYSEHPSDPGGATNFGVSLRYLVSAGDLDGDGLPDGDIDGDGDVDARDIRLMTEADAREIYRHGWWLKYGYGDFEQPIANKLFDTSINMGHRQMTRIAQRTANAFSAGVAVDGQLGPATKKAINSINPSRYLAVFRDQQWAFYQGLMANNPRLRVFANGWKRRAYS